MNVGKRAYHKLVTHQQAYKVAQSDGANGSNLEG